MKTTFLEFEQPIADLEQKIEALRFAQEDSALDIADEVERFGLLDFVAHGSGFPHV